MSIAKLSVNRPVSTLMIFLAVILLGLIAWMKLPQELFPPITYPQITVVTSYENAAPEEIESLITKIIEEAVGTVNNVKRISSTSKEGVSMVMVEFSWGTNMDFAALNVREKIDLVKERLPRESQEPVVMKYNPFDLPIMNLAVTGPYSPMELREICRKYIKDSIEKVEGVASATISGGEEREIIVEIDQPRLRASQISIVSVVDSLKATNVNYPAGTIKESFYEYLVRTMGEYQKVAEIQNTPAALELPEEDAKTQKEKEQKEQKSRRLIYLKDIARVKDTIKEKTSISRYNGKDSISLTVRKQSGSNALNVAKGIEKEIKKLLAEKLPKGVVIQITYDQSKFIKEAIGNVRDAAVQGGILSFLVLILFLWELKSSLIITTAIPICLTATTALMYFGNISLNMMSLGGLAMGVGMVVDNANVVIENIFRYRQQLKKGVHQSAIEGTNEMTAAIVGSTLTNVAVFLPFAFVVGVAGQIFRQLSFTINFSLIISILVALSLVPVLYAISGTSKREQKMTAKVTEVTEKYTTWFKDFLSSLLDKKELIVIIMAGLFLLSLLMLAFQEKQFMPKVDQRQFIIKVDLAPGSRLEITDTVVQKLESLLLGLPETKNVTVNIGSSEERNASAETGIQTLASHQAQIMVNLKKLSKKENIVRSTDDIIQYLKGNLDKQNLEGAEIEYIAQETSFGSAMEQGAPLALEIKGPDLNRLVDISLFLQSSLRKVKGVYGIKSSMTAPSPETKLHILKDKASLYGLSVRDISVTAQVSLKGYIATKFKEKESQEDIDIRVQLRPEDRSELSNLRRLLIHSPLGVDIPMSEVAYLTKGSGPTEIRRIDQQRSILITANVYKRNLSQINAEADAIIRKLSSKVTKDYTVDMVGEQQRMKESFTSLAFALTLAFILVYMLMAGEFESLWQPFLIMGTVPLALIGVAFSLFITRTPLSVVAYLGIIMLGGIAVNNGIVLIEYVNQLRKEGYSAFDAVTEASKTRLRPILMTSLTTILGLLPLALGIGEGAELQAPLALTVMGGLTASTFLTLVFIPSLYLIIEERFAFGRPRVEAEEEEAAAEGEQPPGERVRVKIPMPRIRSAEISGVEGIKPPTTPIPRAAPRGTGERPAPPEEKERPTLPVMPEAPGIPRQEAEEKSPPAKEEKPKLPRVILPPITREETKEEKITPPQEERPTPPPSQTALPPITQEKTKETKMTPPPEIRKRAPDEPEEEEPYIIEETTPPPELILPPEPQKEIAEEEPREETPPQKEKKPIPPQKPAREEKPAAPIEGLNIRQKELLEKLRTLKKITRKEYSVIFKVSVPTAARDLKEMVDKKLLKAQGPLGPGRWYELT